METPQPAAAMIADAIAGAAIITGKRATRANLARVVGVNRCQIPRWSEGTTTPKRKNRRILKRLVMLARLVEQTRADIAHLRKHDK